MKKVKKYYTRFYDEAIILSRPYISTALLKAVIMRKVSVRFVIHKPPREKHKSRWPSFGMAVGMKIKGPDDIELLRQLAAE